MRDLVCEMLRLFYDKGWVSGTGGGICALEAPGRLLLAPTAVHKERVRPEDLFVVDPESCRVIEPPPDASLRPSECLGVFRSIVLGRGAGAVMHSHALSSVLAADLGGPQIAVRDFEMLKGIRGVGNRDTHLIPIVENTPRESELVGQMDEALAQDRYHTAFAMLVRDHGAYVWGQDAWEAKRHAEVYHWLFEGVRARAR